MAQLDERTIYVREDREDPDLKDHLGHNEAPRRKAQRTASNYGGRVPRIGSYMVGRPIESAAAVVGRRLYVQNLSFDVSWQDLKDHFRQAGNVVYADVLTVSMECKILMNQFLRWIHPFSHALPG